MVQLVSLHYMGDTYFCFCIFTVSIIIYVNSLFGEFVWDDRAAVVYNPDVSTSIWSYDLLMHDFWGQNITQSDSHKSYRPLTVFSYRLNYLLFGYNTTSFHVVNVLLFASTAVMVYFISLQSTNLYGARISALIFTFHPIHVEAVASIVGRADLLSGFYYALSILFYTMALRFRSKISLKAIISFGLSFLFAICSSLSKEIGITVFLMLIVIEVVENLKPIILKSKYYRAQNKSNNQSNNDKSLVVESMDRIDNIYNTQLFYPRYLCFDYGFACIDTITNIFDWRNLLPLSTYLFVGILIYKTIFQIRIGLYIALSLLIIPLLPALNIFFPVGTLLAERLLYIPSIGFSLLLGEILSVDFNNIVDSASQYVVKYFVFHQPNHVNITLSSTPNKKSKTEKSITPIVSYTDVASIKIIIILLFFIPLLSFSGLRIVLRNNDWRNERELFTSALSVCPNSLKVLSNYALVTMNNNDPTSALHAITTATLIYPKQVSALVNGGLSYQKLGQYINGIDFLERAIQNDPNHAKARSYLGSLMYEWSNSFTDIQISNELKYEAIKHLVIAIKLGSNAPAVFHKIGSILLDLNQHVNIAIQYLEHALTYSPALQRIKQSNLPENSHLSLLLTDDINPSYTYNQLGLAYTSLELFEKAIENFKNGLQLNPNTIEIYSNLGNLYRQLGLYDEARDAMRKGIDISISVNGDNHYSNSPPAALINNLGLLELSLHKYDIALHLFEQALQLINNSTNQRNYDLNVHNNEVFEIIHNNIYEAKKGLGLMK
eukprot:gene8513-11508_t